MTKAQRILMLAETMPNDRKMTGKIAAIVGTTPSYVRTVVRQRKGRYASEAEFRYLKSPLGRASHRRHDRARYARKKLNPQWLEKERARKRAAYHKKSAENYAKIADRRRSQYERNREQKLSYQRRYDKARRVSTNASALEDA